MNKLFFAFTLLISTTTIAQKLSVGPEIGMNLIRIDKQKIGNNFQPSWHAGAKVDYKFFSWFSVNSGLYYTQKRQGYHSNDTSLFALIGLLGIDDLNGVDLNTYTSIEGRHRMNFFQIPIMGKFHYKKFNASVGGYFGYMFSSQTKELTNSHTPFVNLIDFDAIDPTGFVKTLLPPGQEEIFTETQNVSGLSAIDYGLKIGTGYQMDALSVNVSYLYGFTDYRGYSGDIQNHKYIQLTLDYMFGITSHKVKNYSRE